MRSISTVPGETRNMSAGGLYFTAVAEWTVGSEVECLIQLPVKTFGGRPVGIRCRGKIARIESLEQGGIGVGATIEHFEFLHMEKLSTGRNPS